IIVIVGNWRSVVGPSGANYYFVNSFAGSVVVIPVETLGFIPQRRSVFTCAEFDNRVLEKHALSLVNRIAKLGGRNALPGGDSASVKSGYEDIGSGGPRHFREIEGPFVYVAEALQLILRQDMIVKTIRRNAMHDLGTNIRLSAEPSGAVRSEVQAFLSSHVRMSEAEDMADFMQGYRSDIVERR